MNTVIGQDIHFSEQLHNKEYVGWMTCDFPPVLFNSISVISGRWVGDNERLYAMEPRLRLKRFPPSARDQKQID